jgi:YHS domain-containing protein
MGFMDFLKGGSKGSRCAYCKAEDKELAFSKRFDGVTHLFCSKECSRRFRIDRKKAARNPPTGGSSLPW